MPRPIIFVALSLAVALPLGAVTAAPSPDLKGPDAFADISDRTERSRALFREMGKVIQHPRCLNCHPADDQPRQGMAMEIHDPPVFRGPGNIGVTAMRCSTCHGDENVTFTAAEGSIPGHPRWHLAPLEMAWVGKSLGAICAQLKDPERNGGKTMAEMHEHMAEDTLVGWGWHPGDGREPAPGDQETLGRLTQAWIDTGAACPQD